MGTAQQNANAEHILQAAVKLFAQKGYEATSTREIMEAAGVTKPMLYYYFGSKEGLCRAAITQFTAVFFARLQSEIDKARDPREMLIDVVWLHFQHLLEEKDVHRFFLRLYFGSDRDKFIADIEAIGEKLHGLLMQVVQRANQAGLLRPDCEHDFFMTLHGTIHIWSMEAMEHGVALDRPLAERIVDGLLRGFGKQ